ncbi:hypothetical protein FSP39_016359 [Pinctada imbricata]|uniref:Fibrinogen C-terminal domain-containing protein n=1 Tax=Pinctada imbricata TaxID=66713 RepID=A0AA88YBC5_PINIB|nr:hypothetical protein FSP39_016359 [Pinctada imbricata]
MHKYSTQRKEIQFESLNKNSHEAHNTRKKIKDITFDDCTTIKYLYKSSKSGVYTIHPNGGNEQLVYCDMMTDGGGWTVFQRRYDGSVDFVNRKWSDFKNGFGKVSGEHWLGNELIHKITSQGVYELRFELGDFESNYRHAVYTNFKLQSEHHGYRLTYDKFDHGNAGDSLKKAKNMKFTTKDKDQDIDSRNSATVDNHPGAWWHAKGRNDPPFTESVLKKRGRNDPP